MPVFSISVGDAARFLFGDSKNVDNPKKAPLKSGDMLTFGGESRHIYNGVTSKEA